LGIYHWQCFSIQYALELISAAVGIARGVIGILTPLDFSSKNWPLTHTSLAFDAINKVVIVTEGLWYELR
jgi:hypothetical protein